MSCRTCEKCDISFPAGTINCPVCRSLATHDKDGSPDEHWEDLVSDGKLRLRFGAGPPIFVSAQLHQARGQFWLPPPTIYNLSVGDVIRVCYPGDELEWFEVYGAAPKPFTGWWVVLIDPSTEFADVPVASEA